MSTINPQMNETKRTDFNPLPDSSSDVESDESESNSSSGPV